MTLTHCLRSQGKGSDPNHVAPSGLTWGCREIGGTEEFLDMLPRACWGAAEQLCGEGTLIYPAGDTRPGANFAHVRTKPAVPHNTSSPPTNTTGT